MTQLADGLEGTGTDLFIMDAGWENNYRDWEPHPQRFPNGLKPITDHIRKKGMKAGLWMGLASVDKSSKLYKEYPEWALYDKNGEPAYLHKEFPDLLVDCTYEVWSEYYINDYALIEHADYDWLTNYDDDAPVGPINIRQMAFDRSRAIPTATNLIGNQFMDSPYSKYTFLSLASVKPILVGDSRKLPKELKPWYLKWNTWFKMMDKKYQFTRFTYVSDIFQRPTMSNWDGVYKFNKEKQGGVSFFFRNGSVESERTFAFPFGESGSRYRLFSPEDGKDWGVFSGKELLEKGIHVNIGKQFDAVVLGIERVE